MKIWLLKLQGTMSWYALKLIYCASFAFWFYVTTTLYHGHIGSQPTRLEATLDLWKSGPISHHWFLFFLTSGDAANGIPYGNMPYLFTMFYAGYHLILNFLTLGRYPFATTYLMTMAAMLVASWVILRPILNAAGLGARAVILFFAAGIFATSPYIITFFFVTNHDTPYGFNAIAATVLAFAIWQYPARFGLVAWIALMYCSISGMLGIITLTISFLSRKQIPVTSAAWLMLFAVAIINYLLPMVLAKFVFGQTSASAFMFRTGLDGSTQYFTSHWQALFAPYTIRSLWGELFMKAFVALSLFTIGWLCHGVHFTRESIATAVASLLYISNWAMFPQSISIHPYLYDVLFLVPFDIGIVVLAAKIVVYLSNAKNELGTAIALGAAGLLIHDNLLLLAQGHLLGT